MLTGYLPVVHYLLEKFNVFVAAAAEPVFACADLINLAVGLARRPGCPVPFRVAATFSSSFLLLFFCIPLILFFCVDCCLLAFNE